MKCSIVIPVWNKANFTKSCLNDLARLDPPCEIIVVNNGSTDNTKEVVSNFEDVKIVNHDKNQGFARGCNSGFSEASGDIVVFLNNDIKIERNHSNWLDALISFLDYNPDYLVGPTGGLIDKNCNFVYETSDSNKKINYISGWCVAAKKNTWLKLDISGNNEVFSKEFGYGYFEDTDLGFRCVQYGIKFKLISVPLKHFGHVTARQLGVGYLYKKSKRIFTKKWKVK